MLLQYSEQLICLCYISQILYAYSYGTLIGTYLVLSIWREIISKPSNKTLDVQRDSLKNDKA